MVNSNQLSGSLPLALSSLSPLSAACLPPLGTLLACRVWLAHMHRVSYHTSAEERVHLNLEKIEPTLKTKKVVLPHYNSGKGCKGLTTHTCVDVLYYQINFYSNSIQQFDTF